MVQNNTADRAAAVSFRQLKLFEAIGDLRSVRRASEECALSQPAVTQALAKLEELVGAVLVARRANGSYLNELGEIFHARVKRFYDQMQHAVVDAGLASTPLAARAVVNRLTRLQVRALVSTLENGSFEHASAALGITPASLQRAARDLEANLRLSLFYRNAAGSVMTPVGADLARKMKLALQEIDLGLKEVELAQGGRGSRILIGAMPFGGSVLLASVLDDFLNAYPEADVRIANGNASEMLRSLRGGDVDFMVGLLPEPADDLVSEALATTPYSVVARQGHPLLRKAQVTLHDLMGYDWVVGTPGASRRACFDRLFATNGGGPQTPIATCALPVIRHLLARSDRLTLMTSYELLHEGDRLAAIPYGPITPAPTIGVTMRAGWLATRVHSDFMAIIRRYMSSPTPREVWRKAS